jgi:hypothetical protein
MRSIKKRPDGKWRVRYREHPGAPGASQALRQEGGR